MNKGRIVALLGLASMLAVSGFGSTAVAQLNFRGRPNYGTVTLRPGFLPDPRSVQVVSGGSMAAQQIANPQCRGYITPQPDVVLNLTGTSPWFRIYVTSASDTTLVIRRPDGMIQCADDTYGLNPAIEGTFLAGRYQIWVGAYRPGENAQATLSFTELQSNHP
jgi:hypothetical protein